ncbi:Putative_ATP synthase [Hexamita inflata]|uniref:ATP synthase n=1 Tax=Hexamita inflata TaxID=28002 RepID=A0AA86Q3P6_9EUKA|nr:Putative ATP synthase [Hexamita inflata]
MQEQLQYMSMLADYNDRAFEIEVESEMNASRIKRQMIMEEQTVINQSHTADVKILDQDSAIQRSSFISDSRKVLMEKTKGIFEDVRAKAEIEIMKKIDSDPTFYHSYLDNLIIKTSDTFEKRAVLCVAPADYEYVKSQIKRYSHEAELEFSMGQQLKIGERGVKIYNEKLTICVDSTIKQRLIQAMRFKAPELNAIVLPDVQLIE